MIDGQGRLRAHGGLLGAGVVVASLLMNGPSAWAAGFESPGLGAEAMGRGGAFTAKADDASAFEYNTAGFARQRGTRVYLDAKLTLHDFTYQRGGAYPSTDDPAYAGMAYPKISDSNGLSVAPVLGISTDFGYFDRWTFAVGIITPSAGDANRTYPVTVNGNWPAPQRYDATHINLFVVYPMVAAAVRVNRWLDIGIALQMVYGRFDLAAVANAPDLCPGQAENPQCDAALGIKTSGFSATGNLGLMFHPLENLHIGLQVRGPMFINTKGGVTAGTLPAVPITIDPGTEAHPATGSLTFRLPLVVRLGIRYAFMRNKRELGDIELDGTYEAWKLAQGDGDVLHVPDFGPPLNNPNGVNAQLTHNYKDGGSVRLGGAYNLWFKHERMLAFRLGVFYDSSTTDPKDTRVDFDTMMKIGYSAGLGFTIRGVTINAAYTYIYSPDRTVTNGDQHLINGTTGQPTLTDGSATSVFNNGAYHASSQLILVGVQLAFDEILRKPKRVSTLD